MTTPQTDEGVEGTYARRSTAASRSSPAAAQRGAEGAGLDGGDRGRSTIKGVVRHAECISFSTGATVPIVHHSLTPPIHTTLTDMTPKDGGESLEGSRLEQESGFEHSAPSFGGMAGGLGFDHEV
jgi:hypothetical protein